MLSFTAEPGIYQLLFEVSDAVDSFVESALVIDNIQVVSPEPGTLLLLGSGLAGRGAGGWWKRRKGDRAGKEGGLNGRTEPDRRAPSPGWQAGPP